MANKLPKIKKLPKRHLLPKEIKKTPLTRSQKAYHYFTSEPLYIPFYFQLKDTFDLQRVDFLTSGIMESIWSKNRIFSKQAIRNYLDKHFKLDDEMYSVISKNYLNQVNSVKDVLKNKRVKFSAVKNNQIKDIARDINEHTKDKLANHVYINLKSKVDLKRAKLNIRKMFKQMAHYRSERIAKTELTRAYNDSVLDSSKKSGDKQKKWMLSEFCKGRHCHQCISNASKSWVPLNHVFNSKSKVPPLHPNCDCFIETR